MGPGRARRMRVWRLAAQRGAAAVRARVRAFSLVGSGLVTPTPDRLLIAPQDIRTTDPTVAADIYGGVFIFSGQVVEVGGQSPFEVDPPTEEWERVLHGFGWLRHLRAADTVLARQNARALVDDWIRTSGKLSPIARRPEVAARRLLSWLSQSPLILDGCDGAFYDRFLKALGREVRRLRAGIEDMPDTLPQLQARLALVAAGVSISGQERLLRVALRGLDRTLERQVLPDGGHVSRDPGAVLELLVDLLPVRQALSARAVTPSGTVMGAIDRMLPMLRFFRLGDGTFARFNGMGATPHGLLATVLSYDDARGAPPLNASHSGYQRLEAGRTVVVADVGRPPPIGASGHAHAGTLAFEMSSGRNLFIVNCGAPGQMRSDWRRACRLTAAHSTIVVEDASTAKIVTTPRLVRWVGAPIVDGPGMVEAQREEGPDGVAIVARHDGYARRFGLIAERVLLLHASGELIEGTDRLSPVGGGARPDADRFAVRFHLHPSIRASRSLGGDSVVLVAPDGEAWRFVALGTEAMLEPSVFLAGLQGPRRSEQIVLYGRARLVPEFGWRLELQAEGKPRAARRPGRSSDEGPTLV